MNYPLISICKVTLNKLYVFSRSCMILPIRKISLLIISIFLLIRFKKVFCSLYDRNSVRFGILFVRKLLKTQYKKNDYSLL